MKELSISILMDDILHPLILTTVVSASTSSPTPPEGGDRCAICAAIEKLAL